MEIDIQHRPSYSLAIVKLAPNERIRADSGAMVSHSDGLEIETKAEGGFLKSLGRAVLGGESFFQNFWKAGASGGELTLAPDLPGDIVLIEMSGAPMLVQSGSYLASEDGVNVDAKISAKAFVAAEGVSMLECTGTGKMLVNSYGAIFERSLGANEKYIVDTSHLVAFEASMTVERKSVGGLKSALLSGEGLVVAMTGPGRIYIQTRSPKALIDWIIPQVPQKSS
jgi:uncharacterized protein (TIGR00266 family)